MYRLRATLPLAAATVASLTASSPALAHHSRLSDRDHDGMPDRWEHRHHVRRPNLDPDHDGLTNLQEYRTGHDPHRADDAGTVSLFADGVITIALADGRTVSAHVTPSSVLECEPASAYAAPVARAARHGSDDGYDHSGPGRGAEDVPYYYPPSYQPSYQPPTYAPASTPVTPPAPTPAQVPPQYTPPAAQPSAVTATPAPAGDPVACTPDEIVAGTPVHELELEPGPDGQVVERLELVVPR